MPRDAYQEFVDEGYEPGPGDLVAVFRVAPAEGLSVRDAAARVAAESSVGTWTTLSVKPSLYDRLRARAYRFHSLGDGSWLVWIAYPSELFEEGSIPNLASSVMGNVFGMRAVEALRLEEIRLPRGYVASFPGPGHGVEGVRKILGVESRPILATVPKPKMGYTPEEYGRTAYEILAGGVDLVKDDENVAGQRLCRFEARLREVMKAVERAEKETGERKGYLANVTAPVKEMERRIKLVADYGNKFIMIDFLTAGWAALQHARELAGEYGLAIHGHRAFHAAFTRNPRHGVSMFVVAKLGRLAGLDHLHVGTPGVGKMEARAGEVVEYARVLREPVYKPREGDIIHMEQDWAGLRPVLPVSSGGLHPGNIEPVIRSLGLDIIIQAGGGVIGHPDGPRAGAAAMRQAVEAAVEGVPLEEYAEKHRELARALEKWGHTRPV
ncbi:ribulose 1,5-bisphosphate carboxylase [Pyrodictium occultum]|uniref:Ribulose bisphosphate carboxylase n=1 Tax=Pyrodictium occultum TaxID=2309 RepID=A0A0V8RXM8_PYROC|nr:type III ribulose-bisphosphate carboxylase [Pyrodictium occultum]KSW12714.1 ribulose 1,5-bisphosphate carboxylase [Pyrodictium occultum]